MSILLVGVLLLTATSAVFAEDTPGHMRIVGEYKIDGEINWKIHAGSLENGAQQKTLIQGEGIVDRAVAGEIQLGTMTFVEDAVLTTHEGAFSNLRMISAISWNANPTNSTYQDPAREVYTDQIYAFMLQPAKGETAAFSSAYVATSGHDYIDSFDIEFDARLTDGRFARYISLSSGTADAPYIDDLYAKGSVEIFELIEVFDVIKPLKMTRDWFDLF